MRATDRRRQLLDVAAGLFADRGYRGTTTAEIAAEAGVTEPIIYRHFENKLDLFVILIDMIGRDGLDAWRNAVDSAETAADRLHALLNANPVTNPRTRRTYRVVLKAMSEPVEREIAAALRRHLSALHRFVDTEIQRLQAEGAVRHDEPPAAVAWLLVNAAIGSALIGTFATTRPPTATGRQSTQELMEDLLAAV